MARELVQILTYCDERLILEFPLAMISLTGIGLPPCTLREVQAPFQHGSTYKGFKLNNRLLQLVVHARGCSRKEFWELRRELINKLNPLAGPLTFRLSLDTGEVFDLRNVVYEGTFNAPMDTTGRPTVQNIGFRLLAHDPIWLGSLRHFETLTPTPGEELIFPIKFPIMFDADYYLNEDVEIFLNGDWNVFPDVTLIGELINPTMENRTTGEKIKLFYTIARDEVVTISLEPGNKSCTNNFGDNLIPYLSLDSSFGTFHMSPHPISENGKNEISFYGEAHIPGGYFHFSWRDRYSGV